MSIPVTQLTVEEAHKEFNSLADNIATKYEQLDGGKFGQLIPQHLMPNQPNGQVSLLIWGNYGKDWTCQWQHNFTGCHSSSIEEHFSDLNLVQAGSLGLTGELFNSQDWRLQWEFPPGGARGPVYRVEVTFDTSNMSNITQYTELHKSHKDHFWHLWHSLWSFVQYSIWYLWHLWHK